LIVCSRIVPPGIECSRFLSRARLEAAIVGRRLTELSRSRALFVIACNSSFTYLGRAPDAKQIGRELGVRYVLDGSVRRAGRGCGSAVSARKRPAGSPQGGRASLGPQCRTSHGAQRV
jgi:hypothetical protein